MMSRDYKIVSLDLSQPTMLLLINSSFRKQEKLLKKYEKSKEELTQSRYDIKILNCIDIFALKCCSKLTDKAKTICSYY